MEMTLKIVFDKNPIQAKVLRGKLLRVIPEGEFMCAIFQSYSRAELEAKLAKAVQDEMIGARADTL